MSLNLSFAAEKARANFYSALLKARSEMNRLEKNQSNEHYRSRYSDINAVMDVIEEPLLKNGFMVSQSYRLEQFSDMTPLVVTETRVLHEDGHAVVFDTPMICQRLDPQSVGSAFTYGRRYALVGYFNLTAEDDDGNAATRPVAPASGVIQPQTPGSAPWSPPSRRPDFSPIPAGKEEKTPEGGDS